MTQEHNKTQHNKTQKQSESSYLTFTPHSSNYPDDEYTDLPEESLTHISKLRRDRIRAQRGQQKDRSSYLYKYAYLTTHPSPH
jgi:hypothetical protein